MHRAPFAVGPVLVLPAHSVVAAFRGAGDGKWAVVIDGLLRVMAKQAPITAIAPAFDGDALMTVFGVVNPHPAALRALLDGGGELPHGMVRIVGYANNAKVQPDGFGIGRMKSA
jgi:hypothetical protein